MPQANTTAPVVPTLSSSLVKSFAQKGGTALAALLAAHGWLAPQDQATGATQIAAVLVGAASIAWTFWRDRADVANAKALLAAPPK